MCVDDALLNEYLDGELKEPWRTQVEQHLLYCPSCKSRLERMRSLEGKLTEGTISQETVTRSEARVLAYFEKNRFDKPQREHVLQKTIQVKLVPALLSSAAAFVVVFVGAFAFFGSNSQETEAFLPGAASQVTSTNVRQVSESKRESLDSFTLEEIVDYLDKKGYVVDMKRVEPLKTDP